jgi:uncharacterized protein YbjT (DUF2867 family)
MTNNDAVTLVIGGNGKTGRRVAERLGEFGRKVRIASRSTAPSFDWEDRSTWKPALAGTTAAYVTYYPDLAFPGAAETVGELAGLAVATGTRRLVLLSGRGEVGAQRAEQAVIDSGAEWTVVRSSFFAQNFSEGFLAEQVQAGEFALPAGDTAEPVIDNDDIADVVVTALTSDGHVGRVYEVTGPRLLTFHEMAAELSKAAGREVRYVPISGEDFAAGLAAAGLPDDYATGLTDLFAEIMDGHNSYLTDGVQRALGRAPRDFADYALDAAATGVWGEQQS